jgi:hypothetical protein
MNDLEKLFNKISELGSDIGELIKMSAYDKYDDLSGLKIDRSNAEQLLLLDELKGIMYKLDQVKDSIDYLNKPIVHTGYLSKNSRGRYETEAKEFTCGSSIEVLLYDDFYETQRWVATSVEHNQKDYYIVGFPKIPMQGLKVRVRSL